MTHVPVDPEIPELFDRLEGRVGSPDPEAIRAEATRRGAARQRTLSLAGIFVLAAAIAGGALWATQNSSTETATADENRFTAVSDDSAPIELKTGDRSGAIPALVNTPVLVLRDIVVDGQTPNSDKVGFTSHLSLDVVERRSFLSLTNGCEDQRFAIDISGNSFTIGREVAAPLTLRRGISFEGRCISSLDNRLDSRIGTGDVVSVERLNETSFVLRSDSDPSWVLTVAILHASAPVFVTGDLPRLVWMPIASANGNVPFIVSIGSGYLWFSEPVDGQGFMSFVSPCGLNSFALRHNPGGFTLVDELTESVDGLPTTTPYSEGEPAICPYGAGRSELFFEGDVARFNSELSRYEVTGTDGREFSFGLGEATEEFTDSSLFVDHAQPVVASFTTLGQFSVNGSSVQFSNTSSGEDLSAEWQFGDGATSSDYSPSHTYQSNGTYSVRLTVTGPDGTNSVDSTIFVQDAPTLPDVSGMTFNEALDILFELDLRTSRIDEANSDFPKGLAIRTEPAAGIEVRDREIIILVVSSGPPSSDQETSSEPALTTTSEPPADAAPKVTVLSVETLLADSARQRLTAAGFEVLIEFVEVTDPAQVNKVISQTPVAGIELSEGKAVTIVVGVTAADD